MAALLAALSVFGAAVLVVGLVANYVFSTTEGTGWERPILEDLAEMGFADGEANVWAWYSSLLLAGIGSAFGLLAWLVRTVGGRGRAYLVFAGVALAMSADEAAMFHEKLNTAARALRLSLPGTFPWVGLGIAVTLIAGLVFLWLARGIDRRLRRRLILAGALFISGALGVEAIGGFVTRTMADDIGPNLVLFRHVALLFEEGLEAAGALLALWAVLSAIGVEPGAGRSGILFVPLIRDAGKDAAPPVG